MGGIDLTLDDGTIGWLLSPDNPTVRYRSMTELLGKDEGDREVQAAREAIMTTGPVPMFYHQKINIFVQRA